MKRLLKIAAILLFGPGLILGGSIWFSTMPAPEPDRPAAESCRENFRCWHNNHRAVLAVACSRAVEDQAVYTYEWTAGPDGRWNHAEWADADAGTIRAVGDHVRFANAFGAWLPVEYSCIYDPAADLALAWIDIR